MVAIMKKDFLLLVKYIILLVLVTCGKVQAQLDSRPYGYIYNKNGVSVELLLTKPRKSCSENGGTWIYKLKVKNLSQVTPGLKFINWKLQIVNCSNYTIERNFSIHIDSLQKVDEPQGNNDWRFEAKEIISEIIQGGIYQRPNNEKDTNISFVEKLNPPDTIIGQRQAIMGQTIKLKVTAQVAPGSKVAWYLDSCGKGQPVFVGEEYSFRPEKNIILFVRTEKGQVFSECKRVEITLQSISVPADAIISTDGYLDMILGEQKELKITGGKLGEQARWVWYESSGKGNSIIGSGQNITVKPTQTTTYQVRAEGSFGVSDSKTITITVIEPELFWNTKNPFASLDKCLDNKTVVRDNKIEYIIQIMFEKLGIKKSLKILSCARISTCISIVDDKKKSYILFNTKFLSNFKDINLSSPATFLIKDWENLFILAHEIGYHASNQLIIQNRKITAHDIKLTSDSIAGRIMYHLGASIAQAEIYLKSSLVDERGTETRPSRAKRLIALNNGYNVASKKSPQINAITSPANVNLNISDLPCPQSYSNAYLGFATFSVASGTLFAVGVSKRNNATDWYRNTYSKYPVNVPEADFEKNKRDYEVNSKLFMGVGASTMIAGVIIFFHNIKKISDYNEDCAGNLFNDSRQKIHLEITSITASGSPGLKLQVPLNKK
jgi:hypothetical protein